MLDIVCDYFSIQSIATQSLSRFFWYFFDGSFSPSIHVSVEVNGKIKVDRIGKSFLYSLFNIFSLDKGGSLKKKCNIDIIKK